MLESGKQPGLFLVKDSKAQILTDEEKVELDVASHFETELHHSYGDFDTELMLKYRNKELDCLYGFSHLIERHSRNLDKICGGLMNLLPEGWQHTEKSCVRLLLDNGEYRSSNFEITPWNMSANIKVNDLIVGVLEVYYLETFPEEYEGPFLFEERRLLNGIADRLSQVIERVRSATDLRESEKRHRLLVENLQEGIWSIDRSTITNYVNPRMALILGYTADEMKGEKFYEYFAEENQQKAIEFFTKTDSNPTGQEEFDLIHKDGKTLNVLISICQLSSISGEFVGAIAGVTDITERKKIDRSLRESEQRYRTLIQTVPQGILELDLRGNIGFLNDTCCAMYGRRREELVGKSAFEFISDDKGQNELKTFYNALLKRRVEPRPFNIKVRKSNGDLADLQIEWAYKYDADDCVCGFITIVSDVSKKINDEKHRSQKEKLAAVATLSDGLIHELNQPLTAIQGFIDLVGNDPANQKALVKRCSMIKQATGNIKDIAGRLQTFTRKSEEKNRESVNLRGVIELAGVSLKSKFKANQTNLDVDIDGDLVTFGNASYLERVISNIIENSLDAFGSLDIQGGWIKIFANKVADSISITVKDNAGGIEEEIQSRVFDPFFTTRKMMAKKGLGLAEAYGIANDHGGDLTVESRFGIGSEFTLNLPIATEIPKAPQKIMAAQEQVQTKPRILVVDDESTVCELLGDVLDKKYHFSSRTIPRHALVEIETKKFDLILTDLMMPEVSGLDIISAVNRHQSDTPVVLMTCLDPSEKKVTEALQKGAKGVISKPFDDLFTVCDKLSEYLS